MTDLQETPATPPEEYGGDARAGFLAAGVLLIAIGWGVAIVANLLVHVVAPSTGRAFGPFWVFPAFGPYAWAVAVIGFFAGALGSAMLSIGWSMPDGPLVLPGVPYD